MSRSYCYIANIPIPHRMRLHRTLNTPAKEYAIPGAWLQEFFNNAGLFLEKFRAFLSTPNSNVLHIPAPAPKSW